MAEANTLTRWNYTARNANGELITGVVTAESETAAAKRLQGMGLAPLQISTKRNLGTGLLDMKIQRKKRVRPKHISMFTRQFATMVDAGLPLVRALSALIEQTDHSEIRKVLPLVRANIQAGLSTSAAFAKHSDVFPPLMISMIAAGEVSGNMPEALHQIAENFEKEAKLRSKVVSAMTYPVIVLALAFVLVSGMLVFVVPRFAAIFAQFDAELPIFTQLIMAVSKAMVFILPAILLGLIAFGYWWRKNKNTKQVRGFIDPLKLRVPIFGKFFQKLAVARFSRTLASLLNSGVPILQALDIVSATSGNSVVANALQDVRTAVRSGRPINVTMAEHAIFPPLVNQMIATGEETGQLSGMLGKVADYFENEVEAASNTLSATIEPILLMFLAGIVGSMVLALYLPIFSIFSAVQGSGALGG